MGSYGFADNPDELVRGLVERLPPETAVERLDLEPCDLDQAFPLGLVQPPERDRVAAVERDVDPVVVLELVDPVADAVLLPPLSVDTCGDAGVEDERVPGEATAGPQRGVDTLEDAAPVGPGRQVEQRAERRIDQSGRRLQLEVAHVALTELQLDACRCRALARLFEHGGGDVDPEHGPPGLAGDRNRHATVADRELDERTFGLARELDVEGNVLRHVRGPIVIPSREGVVDAHEADGIVARWTPRRSRAKHGPRSPRPPIWTAWRSCASTTSGARAS